MSSLNVGALGDSDTRLKWSVAAAEVLGGPQLVGVVDTPLAPTARQLRESVGVASDVVSGSISELISRHGVLDLDVIVVCAATEVTASVRRELGHAVGADRHGPVVVTGYAGLVYEHRAEGLSWRIGSDIICVNSANDERFALELLAEYGRRSDRIVRLGFPQFSTPVVPGGRHGGSQLTFATQPDVPAGRRDREYVLSRLLRFARSRPSDRVVVKLRSRPDERTTHPEPYHYEKLFQHLVPRAEHRPPNLVFEYGPMSEVLDRTTVLTTVSSTAAVEAMSRGITTAIIADFGIAERLGNHVFVGSGCLTTFDQLEAGHRPVMSLGWGESHGIVDDGAEELREQVRAVARDRAAGIGTLPPMLPHVEEQLRRRSAPAGLRGRVRLAVRGPLRNAYSRLQAWASQ